MKRGWIIGCIVFFAIGMIGSAAMGSDIELAKKSTLEEIIKRGSLRVGLEAGYLPFEMADKKGDFIGFDVDVAKEMAKAMGVKLEIVNTAGFHCAAARWRHHTAGNGRVSARREP